VSQPVRSPLASSKCSASAARCDEPATSTTRSSLPVDHESSRAAALERHGVDDDVRASPAELLMTDARRMRQLVHEHPDVRIARQGRSARRIEKPNSSMCS
jgi:hypothetical protein